MFYKNNLYKYNSLLHFGLIEDEFLLSITSFNCLYNQNGYAVKKDSLLQ